jgi:hypothetical protein
MMDMAQIAAASPDIEVAERSIAQFLDNKISTHGHSMGGTDGAPVRAAGAALKSRIDEAFRMSMPNQQSSRI